VASAAALLALALGGCNTPIVDEDRVRATAAPAPLRFLLTFDDGPSAETGYNPTAAILDRLADNPWQPGIKAVFFVQSRAPHAGGSALGQSLLRRIEREGHVLALHSGTARGHIRHTRLPRAELGRSLADGRADLHAIGGRPMRFVRPPNWDYDAAVLACYRRHGFVMVLDDIKARDGKTWGFKWNPRLYSHLRAELGQTLLAAAKRTEPAIAGVLPVIVTLHDTNTATARALDLYLSALLEAAQALAAPLAQPVFYADRAQIEQMLERRYGGAPWPGDAAGC
jgi:peptidoglycan/xylan/chitin deacetylase (PgdA/CDA1 family)